MFFTDSIYLLTKRTVWIDVISTGSTFHESIFRKLIVPIQSKVERRERRREEKALIAARIEKGVEKALLDRLKKGVVSIFSYPMKAKFDTEEFTSVWYCYYELIPTLFFKIK